MAGRPTTRGLGAAQWHRPPGLAVRPRGRWQRGLVRKDDAGQGPHLAAQAARIAGVPLTLFGPIEDRDYWDADVVPLLGGSIRYGGHLDAAAVAFEIGRASAFVFTPCWDEPFGLVAIEAMACGLPVAAFDRGALREVIGETGCFAPPGDVSALARAITTAIQRPRAPQRDRVAKAFTRDRWLDRCEDLYRDVVGHDQGPSA